MSSITDTNSTAAGRARQATEKSVQAWKQGTHTLTEQPSGLPKVDLTESVDRYFEFLQRTVDFNRDLAIRWAELVTTLFGSVRDQAESVSHTITDQADKVADLAGQQANKAEQAAKAQSEKVEHATREQAEEAEEAEKAQAREAKRVERAEARKAQQQAREAYEGLTKAELSETLAERDLPKSGTVDELLDRLVTADLN